MSWNIQTLDKYACSDGYGTASPIAVDSKNIPHIAYTSESEPWSAIYASYNGSSWKEQTLAEDSLVQCFALDTNDNPHILYLNRQSGHFEYASWTGTNWSSQNTGIQGNSFALALDSGGSPHIVFTDGGKIKYASRSGETWNIQTLDSGNDIFMSISIALDSKNNPYILYTPYSYADHNTTVGISAVTTKLATYSNGAWNIQTLSLPPPTGEIGNLVIDSKNSPHFICTQHHFVSLTDSKTLTTILYASRDGAAWKTQTVTSDIELQSIGQLVLDAVDNPHFTYLTPAADGETKSYYVSSTGNSWSTQVIDTSNGETASGSLALDNNGNPHISSRAASGMRYVAPLLYVTATGTMDTPSSTVTDQQMIQDDNVLIAAVAAAVIIVVVIIAFVFWKKNISKPLNG